jgi:sacsin
MKRNNDSFGIDFGQKVDLTASIRNILRNYPEGTAVLKELVQNADDAGARIVSFCLDCRNHGIEKLADIALQEFQGPSLLAYNDAIFTEEDFKSIQRIGDSLKKSAESKAKIGRFGIGFNAVYHWTDLPSFVSSKYLVMLDPQAAFLPNVNPSNPGKMVDWITDSSVLEKFRDQFIPYEGHSGLNFDNQKPFDGTLFRLPLRTTKQAETSMLSKRALSVDDALELLEHLRIEASAMLLFLKSVENIEIKVWNQNESTPTTLFKCSIHNITPEIRRKRAFVSDITSENSRNSYNVADYSLTIQCEHKGHNSYIEKWEVCNQLGGKLRIGINIRLCDNCKESKKYKLITKKTSKFFFPLQLYNCIREPVKMPI